MSSPQVLTKPLSMLSKPFWSTHWITIELNNIERYVFKNVDAKDPERGIEVKWILPHLWCPPFVLKSSNISISPRNPKHVKQEICQRVLPLMELPNPYMKWSTNHICFWVRPNQSWLVWIDCAKTPKLSGNKERDDQSTLHSPHIKRTN